jgi:hypothetical protein
MSILTNGLIEYHVPNFRNHEALIATLSTTVPDLVRVSDYWRSVTPEYKGDHTAWTFIHEGEPSGEYEFLAYYGPGGFSVHFGPRVACIGASCRFSGFATIPPLQAVHLPAFRSIARSLGGTRIALMPEENGPIWDAAMYDGASLEDCIALVRKTWGDPHPRTEVVTEDPKVYDRRKFPVWYCEDASLV